MADLYDGQQLEKDILDDLKVELTDEFDQNFRRKAFFTKKWKKRKDPYALGSLLVVTGAMRRSIKSEVRGHGVRFTSSLPYTTIHNEGGKGSKPVRAHTRRSRKGKTYQVRAHSRKFKMPQRQFIGDGPETQRLVQDVIEDNLKEYNLKLTNFLKR